jgi:hypothetical protein
VAAAADVGTRVMLALIAALSMAPSPAPSATPDPWLAAVSAVRYTSRNGASITIGDAIARLTPYPHDAQLATTVWSDPARKVLAVCLMPATQAAATAEATNGPSTCLFSLHLRVADAPAAPQATEHEIGSDDAIGLRLPQLLAKLRDDPNLAAKSEVHGSTGASVVMVTVTDEDPPPATYDHGPQSQWMREYVLRDDVVVAYLVWYNGQ